MLRTTTFAIALLAAFAMTASAIAKPPSKADKRSAAQECKAERGTDDATRDAFKEKYGNLGKCVSAGARERKQARSHASRECRAEREEQGAEAFREQYGTNRNKRNAFGKCVAAKAGEQEEEPAA